HVGGEGDVPAHAAGEAACDGQAQSGSLGPGQVVAESLEAVEDALLVPRCDAGALVAHAHLDVVVVGPDCDVHAPRGVLDGVRDQGPDDPDEGDRVDDGGHVGFDGDVAAGPLLAGLD